MIETKPLTNSLLKEKMVDAMVVRGEVGCLEDTKTAGNYIVVATSYTNLTPPCANMVGVLEVYPRLGGALQRLTPWENPGMMFQRFYSAYRGTWSVWFCYTGTRMS